jgi:hypothetical protein
MEISARGPAVGGGAAKLAILASPSVERNFRRREMSRLASAKPADLYSEGSKLLGPKGFGRRGQKLLEWAER